MSTTGLPMDCQIRLRSLAERFGRIVDHVCESDSAHVGSGELASNLQRAGELLCQAGELLIEASGKGPANDAAVEGHHAWDPAVTRAADQYQYAVKCLERINGGARVTDKAAYEFLKGLYAESKENMMEEFGPLRALPTWTRYLRAFRKATGQQKNKRRKGDRAIDRSAVSAADVQKVRDGESGEKAEAA